MQVEQGLEVCGDALIGGDLRVCGNLMTNQCNELIFTSMDFGIIGCIENPNTLLTGTLFTVYPDCEDRGSRARVVELLFASSGEAAGNRLPYLDFSIPNDFDAASGRDIEIDVHFVTVLDPDNGLPAVAPGEIELRLHFDYVSDGDIIGIICGKFTTDPLVRSVEQPEEDNLLRHYKLTFCIPTSVVANISPMDFARIMFVRSFGNELDNPFMQNVYLIGATFRYPQETRACATGCVTCVAAV